uniref:Putative type I restriction-modification system n=1 Tax=Chlorobium phaeobacteroides (strain BS1) TaxID=331678 RepID=B3ENS6_CHLPB
MSFPRYPKYKASGVEWLGEVPEHWQMINSRRLFHQAKESPLTDDIQLSATQKYGVVPQSLFMESDGKVALALSGLGNFKHVEVDDFVISLRSFQGGIERSKYSGCVSPAYTVLRPAEPIDGSYWGFLLKSRRYVEILQTMNDGLRDGKSISYQQFGQIPLPSPPLAEQTAIAEFLDRETGKIDELVAEQRRLMELLKEKRQAVISHAVTKGLNPHAPMKPSGIEWLGDVPVGWSVLKLGNISRFKGGAGFPDSYQGQTDNEIPFFKVGDMVNADDARVMRRANHTITEATARELRAFVFPESTIVFAKVGAALLLKRYRLLGQRSCIDNNMMGMTVGDGSSVDYLLYVLPLLDLELIVNPGAVPSINEGQISGQRIALPPIDEQREIVEFLTSVTAKFDTLTAEAQRTIDLLQERRTALISAAVTGQIDVRQPPRN